MPDLTEAIIAEQLAQRKWPAKTRRLIRERAEDSMRNAPSDLPKDELQPGNIAELMATLQQARNPTERAVLQAELDRLRSLAENLNYMPPSPSPMRVQKPLLQGPPVGPRTFSDTPPDMRYGVDVNPWLRMQQQLPQYNGMPQAPRG